MEQVKKFKPWISELYLVASTVFYWISTANLLNPVAISLLVILCCLFIWKNKILGLIIAILILMLSIFMVLALISELKEFAGFNRDAKIMLTVGAGWLGLTIVLCSLMLRKWHTNEPRFRHNITLQNSLTEQAS